MFILIQNWFNGSDLVQSSFQFVFRGQCKEGWTLSSRRKPEQAYACANYTAHTPVYNAACAIASRSVRVCKNMHAHKKYLAHTTQIFVPNEDLKNVISCCQAVSDIALLPELWPPKLVSYYLGVSLNLGVSLTIVQLFIH